jgi:hypothetical protein
MIRLFEIEWLKLKNYKVFWILIIMYFAGPGHSLIQRNVPDAIPQKSGCGIQWHRSYHFTTL